MIDLILGLGLVFCAWLVAVKGWPVFSVLPLFLLVIVAYYIVTGREEV